METIIVRDHANNDLTVNLVGDAEYRFHELTETLDPMRRHLGIDQRHGRSFGKDSVQDSTDAFYFFVSQLAYTEAKIFAKKYRPLQFEQFLPVTNEAGEWADSIRYETSDYAGEAEDINLDGDDVPEVQVNFGNKVLTVPYASIGYSYSLEELRRSAFLKRPLPEWKMAAAMEVYRHKLNKTALFGNPTKGLQGFFANSGVTAQANPSGQTWAASVAAGQQDKVISDFNFGINAAWTATEFTTIPNTAIIAPAAYEALLAPRADAANLSILKWLQENNLAKQNGQDLKIVPGYGLDGAGQSGANRNIYYNNDEDNLVMHIPMPLRFVAPQQRGLKIFVPGEFKYSGAHIRRTPTVQYQDGV